MSAIGHGLKEDVRKEIRDCDIHGESLHSQSFVGINANPRWICLACSRDSNRRSHERRQAGIAPRSYIKRVEQAPRKMCSSCFTELPLSGECGVC